MKKPERMIVFEHDTGIETGCSKNWSVETTRLSALEQVAMAGHDTEPVDVIGDVTWRFECREHGTQFMPWDGCSKSTAYFKAGETVSLPADKAEWLVNNGRASYPTHKAPTDESIQSTLDRANALMESMGLPHMDPASIKAMNSPSSTGRGTSRHYKKPGDIRLAGDLGLDLDDIADMRKLAGG